MAGRDPVLEAERRDAVAALVASDRNRMRWRHLLVLALALAIMALCGLGVLGWAWAPAARVIRVSRHRLSEFVPLLVAIYLVAAVFAAWAWARFDARRATVRLPIVIVVGAVGILVLLVAIWIELPHGTGGEGAGGSGAGGAGAGSTTGTAKAEPAILATALVDADEAAAILGAPVGPPDVRGRFLMRGRSLCRYIALDRSATLTVMVGDIPRAASAERLIRRGEPVPGVGDRAVAYVGSLWAFSGQFLLALMVHRRDGRAEDRQALVEGARQALQRLPG